MFKQNKNAFTLVELIVVITILAILGTIAFISLQGYSKSARDSRRISDVNNIKTSLELFILNAGKYPLPDAGEIVAYSGETLWTQGIVGDVVSRNLSKNLNKKPTDPLLETEYTYSVSNTQKEFEILGFFEGTMSMTSPQPSPLKGEGVASILTKVNAISNYTPKISGTYNGVFLKTSTTIVPTPSIITSEDLTSSLDFKTNTGAIKSQIVTGGENFPNINNQTSTGKLDITLNVADVITKDSNEADKILAINAIQNTYSGTSLASNYEYILSKTSEEDKLGLVETVILNNNAKVVASNDDIPVEVSNYEEPVDESGTTGNKNVALTPLTCDVNTTDLGGGTYESTITLSNVCGEDTGLRSVGGYAGHETNYGGNTYFFVGSNAGEDNYESHSLMRFPIEDIFDSSVIVTNSKLYLYDTIGTQYWDSPNPYNFYEATIWDEMTATYNTHEDAYVGDIIGGPISTPVEGGCGYVNSTATQRSTDINIGLVQARILETKTNYGFRSKISALAGCMSRTVYSSEHPNKNYRPQMKITYTGDINIQEKENISGIIDKGGTYNLLNAELIGLNIPEGAILEFDIRGGDSPDTEDLTWSDWLSFKDLEGITQSKRSISSLTGKRYLQYKINIKASPIGSTPSVDNLKIIY